MIPVLSAEQIRSADQYTIQNEPVASIDLMERASEAFLDRLLQLIEEIDRIYVFCGTGNNGGDGLAVARLLQQKGFQASVFILGDPDQTSADFKINYKRIGKVVQWVTDCKKLPEFGPGDVIIDAIFGSGLTRSIGGLHAQVIAHLNEINSFRVSIDIASGLFADQLPEDDAVIFQPDLTISFQVPKWSFFQPMLSQYVGSLEIVDIGLDLSLFDSHDYQSSMVEVSDVREWIPERERFAHKGDFGRLQIVAGSRGKVGAAILTTKAAFRAGAGLIYVNVPACGEQIMHQSVHEAMVLSADHADYVDHVHLEEQVDVMAVGPGIGTSDEVVHAFDQLLAKINPDQRLVLDADAINILSQHRDWLERLPSETILTPHPGEFRRLVGEWPDDLEKLRRLQQLAMTYHLNIVLKGAYSVCCNSRGKMYYNPTGNPGMATAGSGDVLTGIISGLLSSGLNEEEAMIAGVFLHGSAGDLAAVDIGEQSLMASDIINYLPEALR